MLLITGVSATGKSTFTRWLEATHGYMRCPSGEEVAERTHIEVDDAVRHGRKVAFDWGIPTWGIDQARDVIAYYGFETWWFDGDWETAEKAFRVRQNHPSTLEHFETYKRGIEENWPSYESLFGDRILEVLRPGPSYMSNEDRLTAIRAYGRDRS
jgi:hypothetical protein